MGLRCKRCGSGAHVKNGLMRGQQRYLCKDCGLNFTDTPPRGKPLALKAAAVLLYVSGLSMNRTAKLLGVSTPTIQAWLEQVAAAYAAQGLALLVPALMQLPQPLALLEVGASAGLCLLPDRYAYDFDGHHLTPESATDFFGPGMAFTLPATPCANPG